MRNPVIRKDPRQRLVGETKDGNQIEHLTGDWIVWWYERLKGNINAETNPLVEVIFRRLDNGDVPTSYSPALIGLANLSKFRHGTIWRKSECIAEADFGDDEEFSVHFAKVKSWEYASFPKITRSGTALPISDKDYPFLYSKTAAKMLDFKLPDGKNLLVPCIDFFVRCYGSKTSIPAIIAAHPWSQVHEKLFASEERNRERWSVPLRRGIPDSDGLFLASLLYDAHAIQAARRIYSQFDVNRGQKNQWTHLEVEPWFVGPAKISGRGLWINDGKTFLCLEVTGMSQPHRNRYEIIRAKYDTEDPIHGQELVLPAPSTKLPFEDDPFRITDQDEPASGAATRQVNDPGFKIIGDACPHIKTQRSLPYSSMKFVPIELTPKTQYALGDGIGGPSDTARAEFNAERYVGDGGVVTAIWSELLRLNAVNAIADLAWYSSVGFIEHEKKFKLQPLKRFEPEDTCSDVARRWLSFPSNGTRTRGILITRFSVQKRVFHLFELQRKKVIRAGTIEEEKASGFLIETAGQNPLIAIDLILDKIRRHQGKFHSLLKYFDIQCVVFKHYRDRNGNFLPTTTIRSALKPLDIQISL